jgi:hypothetical protein
LKEGGLQIRSSLVSDYKSETASAAQQMTAGEFGVIKVYKFQARTSRATEFQTAGSDFKIVADSDLQSESYEYRICNPAINKLTTSTPQV